MTETELGERGAEIVRLEAEARQSTTRECELIAEMGRILIETKDQLEHGAWLPWLEGMAMLSQPTANRYMRVAANHSALNTFFPLGRSAVYALLPLHLTPDVEVNGKKIQDLTTPELEAAVRTLQSERAKGPGTLTQAMGHVAGLEKIRKTDTGTWQKIVSDVHGLLAEAEDPTEKLNRILNEARQILASLPAVPPELRAQIQTLARLAQGEVAA